jgi:hypothetical protein
MTVVDNYVKFDSPKKAQQLPESMNYILPQVMPAAEE